MKTTLTRVAAGLALAVTLASAPALAQSSARPGPREGAIIRTMNDVYALMSKDAKASVEAYLADARKALKSGDDDRYEKSLDEAMMIVAKELSKHRSAPEGNG